ncbi:MAG TPA: PQQ-binding-like beta-propeller repeat protein [Actinoplanes sp.]|nr:PQQ-binding-like beta-propeller repeat protein [Actinoplanes sp.]
MKRRSYYLALAAITIVTLALTGVWNPFPAIWSWIDRSKPLATPAAVWQQRLGGAARSVTIAGVAAVVEYRTRVEAFGLTAGVQLWERNADWSAVAGGADDAVVVTGKLLTKGYEVVDPGSGVTRRTDTEAVAVWTYDSAILDVRCAAARDCQLSAWAPRGTKPEWTVSTPGIGFVLFADNPDLPGTRTLESGRVADTAAGPATLPGVIGFPADGKLHLVDTASGRVLRVVDNDRSRRVSVAGDRLLTVTADARDGTCYFAVTAVDPATGQQVWRRDGLNLRTAGDGTGCKPDQDPTGGTDVLLGVRPTGREVLLDAHDGRVLWTGAAKQQVLAVDDRYALIRSADGRTVTARSFGKGRTVWRRPVAAGAGAALSPYAAVVTEAKPDRITALHPATGAVLAQVRSEARVVAVGRRGMIISAGRDLAYVSFAAST